MYLYLTANKKKKKCFLSVFYAGNFRDVLFTLGIWDIESFTEIFAYLLKGTWDICLFTSIDMGYWYLRLHSPPYPPAPPPPPYTSLIQVSPYFKRPEVPTRHMHHLPFRRIHTYANYQHFFFCPATVALWNKLDPEVALIIDPNSFKDRVRAISYQSP